MLEVPREALSSTEDPTVFTRNPRDRYLTPVPPGKPLPSPRPCSSHREAYTLPSPSPWAPKSATYPPTNQFLSPNVSRHTRSASASPQFPSTPLLAEFKDLKEKLVSKRARSRSRSSSDVREMHISAPVLISTTADGVLPTRMPSPPRSPRNFSRPQKIIPPSISIPTITKEFSPLSSHPVDISEDSRSFIAELPANEPPLQRRRSYVPPTVVTHDFGVEPGRSRANSADTRRTKRNLYANDPWVSSPRFKHEFGCDIQHAREVQFFKPAPVLRRPTPALRPLAEDERPCTSHGGSGSPTLRDSPLQRAPSPVRQLVPAPSLAYAAYVTDEKIPVEEAEQDDSWTDDILRAYEAEEEPIAQLSDKKRSHFSTWSSFDSYVTSDDDGVASPVFSSASSVSSDAGSPQHQSISYSFADHAFTKAHQTTTIIEVSEDEDDDRTSTPPQLDLNSLRLSAISFSSDLFSLDIQHQETMPRRQAACFGMGFQGYSLPQDEMRSKDTVQSEVTLRPKQLSVQRESSTSQLNALMDDFSYLGDAVL